MSQVVFSTDFFGLKRANLGTQKNLICRLRELLLGQMKIFTIFYLGFLELEVAAGGLLHQGTAPVIIVNREGPTGNSKNSKKKKKKSKNEDEIPERGLKTSSLHDAIEVWQHKYKNAKEDNTKLDKKERFSVFEAKVTDAVFIV